MKMASWRIRTDSDCYKEACEGASQPQHSFLPPLGIRQYLICRNVNGRRERPENMSTSSLPLADADPPVPQNVKRF